MPDSNFELLHKGFEENRTKRGGDFQEFVIRSINEIGFSAYLSGTENTLKELHEQITLSNDAGSLFMRFFPDIIALIGKPPHVLFVEAKASMNIERMAWEQYMSYATMGLDVVLVAGESKNGICNMNGWNFIENIHLYSGEYTVGKFPEDKRFPVVDDWITPRGSRRFNTVQSGGTFGMSGAPYREIDSSSLLPWELFTRIVFARYNRLSNQ